MAKRNSVVQISTANWFSSALAGMLCFAVLSLVLKRLTMTLSPAAIMLWLFAFTFVLYGLNALRDPAAYAVTGAELGWLAVAAGLAFFANVFDMQALAAAPNAGYAAAVKAGQIVIITLAALVLFREQTLTVTGAAGVTLILAGIALLATQGSAR